MKTLTRRISSRLAAYHRGISALEYALIALCLAEAAASAETFGGTVKALIGTLATGLSMPG